MVSVDQAYMVGHMKNADGSINNKNVVLSAACEAAELLESWCVLFKTMERRTTFISMIFMKMRWRKNQ